MLQLSALLRVVFGLSTTSDNHCFAGPALQYLPGLIGFFAANFAVAYLAWGLYGLSGKKR